MIAFSTPLALLLFIPLVALVLWTWRTGYVTLGKRRGRLALAVRFLLLASIVLALAGTSLQLTQSRQAVIFIADLSQSDAGARSSIKTTINNALVLRSGDNTAGVVTVGRQAVVEQPVSSLSHLDDFQTPLDPDYTNLAGGLELGNAILPDNYRKRAVLLSDGRQNVGDALAAARLLHAAGVRVDVAPVHVNGGPEVLVDGVSVPANVRPREQVPVTVTIRSTVGTSSKLDLFVDRRLTLSKHVVVQAGENRFSFDQQALQPGFHTFQVHITPAVDSVGENNSGSAFTTVAGPARVLVIADIPAEARNVVVSLRKGGITTDLRQPTQVTPTLGFLQQYASVVIVDTAADVLGPLLLQQLVPYVRDLGHGLAVIGGQQAYGMGSYGQTPLEQALPVNMDLPKRRDLPSTAVVIIIESLEAETEVNISKQAGKGVINLLTPQDMIAVNDGVGGHFAVPLQHVTNKAAINRAIDTMDPGDPESYIADLDASAQVLKKAKVRIKHIILLGDGDAEDPGYQAEIKKIRGMGITISTVGTNGQGWSDLNTMRNIAQWGGGRYYRADNTAAVPTIFLREARTVARSGIIPGKFYPLELSANPILKDMRSVPPLYGYVATTAKPAAEMVLVSKKLDPVLAAWQFGLGRSVAWTSDASGLWTQDWLLGPGGQRFWSDLVSWTLPATQGGHLYVSTAVANGQGEIAVDTPRQLGANPDVTAHVLAPNLKTSTVQLQPSAPGHYKGSFVAGSEGAYFLTVQARGAGHGEAGAAGLAVPYSAEYRTSGTDTSFLRTLAAAGGGSILSRPEDAWLDNLAPVSAPRPLATWLLLLALLLLPVDIGIRRLIVSRSDLVGIWNAIPFRRKQTGQVEPIVAPLGALRARRVATGAHTLEPVSVPLSPGQVNPPDSRTSGPPPPVSTIPVPTHTATPRGSTAGALLRAKRKRQGDG